MQIPLPWLGLVSSFRFDGSNIQVATDGLIGRLGIRFITDGVSPKIVTIDGKLEMMVEDASVESLQSSTDFVHEKFLVPGRFITKPRNLTSS